MRTVKYDGREYTVSDAHPAADMMPWHTDRDEFGLLLADMRTVGFDPTRPCLRREGSGDLIDGRRRELAATIVGIEPKYQDVRWDDEEIVEWVKREHLPRRNLTPSERAAAAVGLAGLLPVGSNQHARNARKNKGEEGPQNCGPSKSAAAIAAETGVSQRTVEDAAKVKKDAPELMDAVKEGQLPANTAAKVAGLSKESRATVAGADDKKKAAKDELKKAAAARDKAIRKALKDSPDATPKQIATAVGKHCTVKHVEAVVAADKAKAAKKEAAAEKPAEPVAGADDGDAAAVSPPAEVPDNGPLGYDANDLPAWAVVAETGFTTQPVPEPEAERYVREVEAVCRDIDAVNGRLDVLGRHPLAYSLHVPSAVANLKSGRQTLWQGRPKHACPYCDATGFVAGKPCRGCAVRGRVKKSTFDAGKSAGAA
jgi:hypothetical protein